MIPFNSPFLSGTEAELIGEVLDSRRLGGDGALSRRCERWMQTALHVPRVFLTPSCTAALEMTALLAGIQAGDEVIMASYTFPSTANAFVLRGGVPVFVDIREDTLNLDESLIEAAISPRTRAIVPMHYAGVACAMDRIEDIARRHGLMVIEDAAQAYGASFRGRALGSIGSLGCLSFHQTKNLCAGEGGALLVNDEALAERAELLREKGTNRSAFLRGDVDHYAWCDVGTSCLPSELVAAMLWAQLQAADTILEGRLAVWARYHERLAQVEHRGWLRRPIVPAGCQHNAHIYFVLLPDSSQRAAVSRCLREAGIEATTHYVPLHSAPAGRRHGRAAGPMTQTERLPQRLLRLPLWVGVDADEVADAVIRACEQVAGP